MLTVRWSLAVGVASHDARLIRCLSVSANFCTLHVAHHSLLSRADRAVVVERGHVSLAMEAADLELAKLDIKVRNEVLEDVAALCHKFRGLLIS